MPNDYLGKLIAQFTQTQSLCSTSFVDNKTRLHEGKHFVAHSGEENQKYSFMYNLSFEVELACS